MPKDYLDDFVCDMTCEEYYDEDEDMFWGDQEEQAHAGGMIEALANSAYPRTNVDMRTQWDINADTAENVYGSYVDRHERFFICPECGETLEFSTEDEDEEEDAE